MRQGKFFEHDVKCVGGVINGEKKKIPNLKYVFMLYLHDMCTYSARVGQSLLLVWCMFVGGPASHVTCIVTTSLESTIISSTPLIGEWTTREFCLFKLDTLVGRPCTILICKQNTRYIAVIARKCTSIFAIMCYFAVINGSLKMWIGSVIKRAKCFLRSSSSRSLLPTTPTEPMKGKLV